MQTAKTRLKPLGAIQNLFWSLHTTRTIKTHGGTLKAQETASVVLSHNVAETADVQKNNVLSTKGLPYKINSSHSSH